MTYEGEYTTLPSGERRIGLTLPTFGYSDIFDQNIFYAGTTFQIQEIATIDLSIDNAVGIDVDLKYFFPNEYLGTWQLLRETGIVISGNPQYTAGGTNEPDQQGTIVHGQFKIARTSFHTIGDASQAPRQTQAIQLDGCNFLLIQRDVILDGISTDIRIPRNPKDLMIGKIYSVPPPLEDRRFFSKIGGIGLYLSPGVSFFSATYTAAVINVINHGAELQEPITCFEGEEINCFLLAQAWYASNGVYGDGVTCSDETGQACQIVTGLNIVFNPACQPIDSYWIPIE